MDAIFEQAFGPDSSILGRIIAIGVLVAIATFVFVLRSTQSSHRNSPQALREEAERERRAEAIVAQARRELAEKKRTAEGG